MKVIAIYHNKGGVGKTTTVTNLAAAIARRGKRVLIVDLDAQANTTFATGLLKFDDEGSDDIRPCNAFHLLASSDFDPVSKVARGASFADPSIDVIPAHIDLIDQEATLSRYDRRRVFLAQKLESAKDDYDLVLIDTPPARSLYAEVALVACDYLIIPSDLKPFSNQGLEKLGEFINDREPARQNLHKPPIKILGVLPSKISTNPQFVKATLPKRKAIIPQRYGFELLDSVIFEREDLAKCAEKTYMDGDREVPEPKSVFDFKPDSDAAKEFDALANEVLQKIGMLS